MSHGLNKWNAEIDGSTEDFVSSMMAEMKASLQTFATKIFKFRYKTLNYDFFLYRQKEFNAIGLDISGDLLLMDDSKNDETSMDNKINHFVRTYYLPNRMNAEYVKNMHHVLKRIKDSAACKDDAIISDLFKETTSMNSKWTAYKALCIFVIGCDNYLLCFNEVDSTLNRVINQKCKDAPLATPLNN